MYAFLCFLFLKTDCSRGWWISAYVCTCLCELLCPSMETPVHMPRGQKSLAVPEPRIWASSPRQETSKPPPASRALAPGVGGHTHLTCSVQLHDCSLFFHTDPFPQLCVCSFLFYLFVCSDCFYTSLNSFSIFFFSFWLLGVKSMALYATLINDPRHLFCTDKHF